MTHIAVIDIGKTNAKLALVDGDTLQEIAVETRPNRVIPGPPWPTFDLQGHWDFILHHLACFHRAHGVDAISVTTHGASCVLLDAQGNLAAPMLDYEHPAPDDLAAAYDAIRPDFAETGSARLPMGLNLGAQLHWLFATDPTLKARTAHILTYPQYWGFRLTGALASDVSSLGCHTDLWNPWGGQFSSLVSRLGIEDKLAPARKSGDVLGHILPEIAAQTGLRESTPVVCGIHDSNASLYPHLLGRTGAFNVVSTGTWVVVMSVGGNRIALDKTRDVLVNVNALGQPTPSARFMGGREYEIIRNGETITPTAADRQAVLKGSALLLPAVEPNSGPFQHRAAGWEGKPATPGQRMVALAHYLALMTDTCLTLTGGQGPVIVEGPFARNPDYLDMLTALRPDGVETAASATGTSIGAALLCLDTATPAPTDTHAPPKDASALRRLARRWQEMTR
ncbi:FGGY-family carbohydrate kinase [Neogemmobacter tilapiae]|uniref:Carbohydrate kinase n=1 Tax=Neogemmobacter tilapiae TaxID=875041 RepID=A0A918WM89_9RHOB|nr:FGGY-family carbohydrate kinase [Gemmobacter tilapiae]GHC59894.1 carbohydrate kinase [Gemmobacter tilapiae]